MRNTNLIYNYVAAMNPQGSRDVIQSFGYDIKDTRNMGNNLKTLVAREGQPALAAILAMHPDKDVIMEMNKPAFAETQAAEKTCGCNKCGGRSENFLGADGIITAAGLLSGSKDNTNAVTPDTHKLAATQNAMIIGVTLILAVIIFKMK